jgi:hypothetical protein
MSPVDRAPTRLGSGVAVAAASVAALASGLYAWPALAVGAPGLLLVVVAVVRGGRTAATLGAAALVAAGVVAGARGAPVLPVLVAVGGSVLAWDAAGFAIGLGNQLGRDAETTRVEGLHLAASAVVAVATAGVGYGVYRSATGGHPVAALVFLLLGAVLLVEALV